MDPSSGYSGYAAANGHATGEGGTGAGAGAGAGDIGSHRRTDSRACEAGAAGLDEETVEPILNEVSDKLEAAFKLSETEKKKDIKKLLLKHHPDKNLDSQALATMITQHIYAEVERLGKGLPRPGNWSKFVKKFKFDYRNPFLQNESFQKNFTTKYKQYMEEMNNKGIGRGKALTERQKKLGIGSRPGIRDRNANDTSEMSSSSGSNESTGRSSSSPSLAAQGQGNTNAAPAEAAAAAPTTAAQDIRHDTAAENIRSFVRGQLEKNSEAHKGKAKGTSFKVPAGFSFKNSQSLKARRFFRQAQEDLKSADNDWRTAAEPAFEWVCFKAHQAAEKALKAAQFSADGVAGYSHDLYDLAATIQDMELPLLAAKLQSLVGDPNHMYNADPSDYDLDEIPHEQCTYEKANDAIMCARNILDRVDTII